MKRTTRKGKYLLQGSIIFFLFLIGIRLISYRNELYILGDEFGYWGIAANYAGYQWNELLNTILYYSYGYSLLLSILFQFKVDSMIMYKMAIILNVILNIFSYWLACKCGEKLLPQVNKKILYFICGIISCYTYVLSNINYAWPEVFLYFCFWLITFLLLKFLQKPKIGLLFCISVSLVFVFFVHQRTLGIIMAFAFTLLLKGILERKNMLGTVRNNKIKLLIILFIFISILFLCIVLKKNNINAIFGFSETVSANDFSGQTSKLKYIVTVAGFMNLTRSLFGKIFYLGSATFMVGIVAILALIRNIWEYGKQLWKKENIFSAMAYLELFLLLSFLAMLFINAIFNIIHFEEGKILTRPDKIFYGRYMEFVFGPVLLVGFRELLSLYKNRKLIVISTLIYLGSAIVTNFGINQADIIERVEFNTYGFNYFYLNVVNLENVIYIGTISTILIFVISISLIFWGNKKRKSLFYIIAFLLIGGCWLGETYKNDQIIIEREEQNQKFVYETVDFLKTVEHKKHISYVSFDNEDSIFKRYIYYLQFNLYQYEIGYEKIDENSKELNLQEDTIYIVLNDSLIKEEFLEKSKLLYTNEIIYLFETSD